MNIKLVIIEQLRQLQHAMHRTAFHSYKTCSSFRGQGKVLSILKENPSISRKELGERLDISRQSLSELLLKLERSGYIVREPSQKDHRQLIVRLTETGRIAAEETDVESSPLPGLLDCLNPEELSFLSGYLARILDYHLELYPELVSGNTLPHEEPVTQTDSSACDHCTGPDDCTHDYLKYGHNVPNPDFCKYAHTIAAMHRGETAAEK